MEHNGLAIGNLISLSLKLETHWSTEVVIYDDICVLEYTCVHLIKARFWYNPLRTFYHLLFYTF